MKRKVRLTREQKTEAIFNDCLVKMFKMVGEKYPNKELTDKENWYRLRKWTELEEKIFREWMIEYLRKKVRFTKKRAILEVAFFILEYGWTTNKKEIERVDGDTLKIICN
jgi:alpha-amylase/alpha-mannosidase (GH57 family)